MVSLFSSTFGVFLSVLCDNLLLTVVVPILPELLREKEVESGHELMKEEVTLNYSSTTVASTTITGIPDQEQELNLLHHPSPHHHHGVQDESCLKQLFHLHMLNENSQLGILFSTKAIMQLVCNPLVGSLTLRIGYKIPLCIGNFILFLCSLVFGFADSYILFLIGRSFHGLASSLVAISGMALVAELYQYDTERTRFLGRVMGAAALGVLIGYPFGGFLYAFIGKTMPFILIAILALFNTGLHASKIHVDWMSNGGVGCFCKPKVSDSNLQPTSTWRLWKDRSILIISIAIWISTMAMAVLEPTLPVWLIDNIDPPKWQLGLVFVPDSLGYFTGTNFFGQIALRLGRWKTSMLSMAAIGSACLVLPLSKMVWQLALPHFILGLGLGIVDASLMPLLAKIADESYHAGYGAVYALAQTSVALAYSLGPLIGGQLVPVIGFPDLMISIGIMNLLYSPFLLFLMENTEDNDKDPESQPPLLGGHTNMQMTVMNKLIQPPKVQDKTIPLYQRFYDDSDWD